MEGISDWMVSFSIWEKLMATKIGKIVLSTDPVGLSFVIVFIVQYFVHPNGRKIRSANVTL